MNEDEATPKKKGDKPADNITVSIDKSEPKKDKTDSEEPKPRIVLTFRSEKSNTKSANMKIVSAEEKQEEVSPRRSSRTRGKWDWVCDSDTSISPKKDKSQPVSENDESDSSHTAAKRTRRRSRDDNILASAIARKVKSYDEATPVPTQRLSRRIKPTAKILANEELRMGLESQNNARLGIQTEKSPEEGVRTRRSARPAPVESSKPKIVEKSSVIQPDVVELDSDSQNSDMKAQHLCILGLKAIDPEEVEAEPEEDDNKEIEEEDDEAELLEEDEEEIDDDSEVISKLLEADEDTGDEDDDEFLCAVATSKGERPRRSTRLCSSFGMNDSDRSSPVHDDDSKAPRRSSRRAGPDDTDRSHRTRRKRRHSDEEPVFEVECEDGSNPAGGEVGSVAACPTDKSTVIAKCYCDTPSNVYADPADLTEPVFCQAVETVEGVRVGCSHSARRIEEGYGALLRAGPRAPFALTCSLHALQLARHMCCPGCGLFCSQGIFYQCSEGHLFHLECGLPYSDTKAKPGCPHCGVFSYRWQPVNTDCCKVKVEMNTSNKRIYLPDQREQCTPAYLGFSTLSESQLNHAPVIPEDLLPSAKDLKLLCEKPAEVVKCTPQELADCIMAGEALELLIPKILSGCKINKRVPSLDGGTCAHAAARSAHLAALHALRSAGAELSARDNNMITPLMRAVLELLDKSELKPKKKKADNSTDDMEVDVKEGPEVTEETSQDETASKTEENKAKDEDLLQVIRYLVAAGVDVNLPDHPDGMSPLHVAAQNGSVTVVSALLEATDVCVDALDHGGWTPLVWAAENQHHDVVRLLLSAGASPTTVDKEGNSAYHWCALAGASHCLQLLLLAANVADTPNKHTDTPLHIAARQGHYACVVILLARGARTDIENSAGELPIDVSSGACQNAIALNMQMKLALKDKFTPYRVLSSDISNGREPQPLPCINEVDSEPAPPDLIYVTRHVTPSSLDIDYTVQSLQGCTCADGACSVESGCSCVSLGVKAWWRGGRLAPSFPYREPPMLFQCNTTCRCNPKLCGNSVVSRLSSQGSLFTRAEVYRVGGAMGWGLRASAPVLRGAPVATYCGELLPLQQADTRPDDSYMFALDVKADLLEQCKEASPLCVDASRYGSAARFINHSCAPNLAPVRVYTDTRDLRLPTVALFATRDIRAGEQLTFDYGDKFWSVKSKFLRCECGSPECRYPVQGGNQTES